MKYIELKEKSEKELLALLKEQKFNLFNEKQKLRTMQLSNPKLIGQIRKDIARIKTAINALKKG